MPARDALMRTLKSRFEQHMSRHLGVSWHEVMARLEASPSALASLGRMEASGGEPDVVTLEKSSPLFSFCDCAPESPPGRRSLCFDGEALRTRRENKPEGSAMEMAAAMGIELLSEQQYRALQQYGEFDLKTSSWVQTPPEIRKLGGALFCDRRYGQVFVYHNGAQSYYAARGWRGLLRL